MVLQEQQVQQDLQGQPVIQDQRDQQEQQVQQDLPDLQVLRVFQATVIWLLPRQQL